MKSGNAKPDARTISFFTESSSRKLLILLIGMTILTRDHSIVSPTLGTGAIIRTTARWAF
ncbi:MAG TPA: hypothetical protein PKK23_03260 [Nitrospirales bacterium]|nr:hypothetical protein [Nitrospirales bacterium]